MARRSLAPIAFCVLTVATLLALAGTVGNLRDRRFALSAEQGEILYVTSAPLVRRLTVGFETLAADLYWIRAVQYFGAMRLRHADVAVPSGQEYSLLYPLLDLTTTLDPAFDIAYRFGSIFLAEPPPGGAGRPDQAVALLEKGLRATPDKWQYAEDIGFVHYWWVHDYREAASWFERASAMPNAPWWLRSLAATTRLQGGDRESSRQMWQSIRDSADNDWLKASSERALAQLQAIDQIELLQAAVDKLYATLSSPPVAGTHVQLGGRAVVDPTGVPYQIEASGRVGLGDGSTLAPLPNAPKRLP